MKGNLTAKHNHNKGGRHMTEKDRPRNKKVDLDDLYDTDIDFLTATEIRDHISQIFYDETCPDKKSYSVRDWALTTHHNVPEMVKVLAVRYVMAEFGYEELNDVEYSRWNLVSRVLHYLKTNGTYYRED